MMKRIFTILLAFGLTSAALMAAEGDGSASFDRGVGKMNTVFIPKGILEAGFHSHIKPTILARGQMMSGILCSSPSFQESGLKFIHWA